MTDRLERYPAVPDEPFTLMTPLIVTSPVASIVTGVFAALRVKDTPTPEGMLIVV
jgi:hypothetical protein